MPSLRNVADIERELLPTLDASLSGIDTLARRASEGSEGGLSSF